MSGPPWRRALNGSVAFFEDQLRQAGFVALGDQRWRGALSTVSDSGARERKPHVVTIPDEFPFDPPKVRPEPVPDRRYWHMEPDGTFCLYREAEGVGRPWEDLAELERKVEGWYEQTHNGWSADPGDLDLDRYWPDGDRSRLVVFDELDELVGKRLERKRVEPKLTLVTPAGPLAARPGRRKKKGERHAGRNDKPWAAGVCVGHLDQPIHTWDGLLAAVHDDDAASLRSLAGERSDGIVVVRYSRHVGGRAVIGALALSVTGTPEDRSTPSVVPVSVEDRQQATRNRAGHAASTLAGKSVAVVGVGAVGSFVAEGLARSGIGRLALVDAERLRFGNCIRHLADHRSVNQLKVDAVAATLSSRGLMDLGKIERRAERLSTEMAFELAANYDLVIDATANSRAHDRLGYACDELGCEWIRVGLHRGGTVARVDRLGPRTSQGSERLPPITATPGNAGTPETGCGDPVSPTPPIAVQQAAVLACRVALDTLTNKRRLRQFFDSIVEVLSDNEAPSSDLYASVGFVSEGTQ